MGDRLLVYDLTPGPGGSEVLTAHLHVSFHFPHESDWPPGQSGRWKHRFRTHAERSWSRKYELVAEGGLLSRGSRVTVEVRVHEVTPGSVHRTRHWWVAVNSPRRDPQEWLTRTIYTLNGPLPHSDVSGNRSGLVKFNHGDIDCGQTSGRERPSPLTLQRGTDHEVGHMLGMQHPYCNGGHVDEGDADSASCYWRPGRHNGRTAASYSMMGIGNRMSPGDYAWAKNLMEGVTGRRYRLRQAASTLTTCSL